MTILLAAWVAASGTALSLSLVVYAWWLERALEAAALSLGATSANVEVDLLSGWLRLVLLYLAVVVLPAVAFWLLWRRGRRAVVLAGG